MMGLWNSLLGPLLPDWSVQPKNVPAVSVEDAAVCASVAEQDPMPVLRSSDGRDEPEHLRRKRERVRNAEVERDIALADYELALARYRDQQPVWQEES